MTQWRKLLKSLGFTDSEANIYLVSLEMGPASVQDLAKKANVSRVTTYAVIETLMKNGLMSTVQKGKKNMFVAESPERLISHVQSKVETMKATLQEVSASLHELKLVQRGEKPVVKMFEGEEAIRVMQEDVLNTQPKEIYEFENLDDARNATPPDIVESHGQKVNRFKPNAKLVYKAESGEVKPYNTNLKSIRLDSKLDFHGGISIYGNKVSLVSYSQKPICVIIESKNIADTMRALYEEYWKLAKK